MLRRLTRLLVCAGAAFGASACTDESLTLPGKFVEDTGGKACPDAPDAPKMIAVGGWNGQAYCIDTTEVTSAQYGKWLASSPKTDGQRSDCAFNLDFAPTSGPPLANDRPVVDIDFCDAAAFCEAFGKRLCGNVGGGPQPYYGNDDPSKSQWFSACSHGGRDVYPYGGTYDANACNGSDSKFGAPLSVGALAGCAGGFEGLVDMSGNVWEWEDACIPGDAGVPVCRRRGGSFSSSAKYLECGAPSSRAINESEDNLGFRCCAD